MHTDRPAYLAAEARRLQNERILKLALNAMKADAVERLCRTDPDNKTAIIAAQADIRAIEELPDALARFVLALPEEESQS